MTTIDEALNHLLTTQDRAIKSASLFQDFTAAVPAVLNDIKKAAALQKRKLDLTLSSEPSQFGFAGDNYRLVVRPRSSQCVDLARFEIALERQTGASGEWDTVALRHPDVSGAVYGSHQAPRPTGSISDAAGIRELFLGMLAEGTVRPVS